MIFLLHNNRIQDYQYCPSLMQICICARVNVVEYQYLFYRYSYGESILPYNANLNGAEAISFLSWFTVKDPRIMPAIEMLCRYKIFLGV